MCTVSGAVGHRLGQTQIDRIVPIFLKFCVPEDAISGDDDLDVDGAGDDHDMADGGGGGGGGGDNDDDDDEMVDADHDDDDDEDDEDETAIALANELRESCFNGFESFVSRCPTEVEPHLDKIIQAALAYMAYDPNYSYGADEDDDDGNNNGEGGGEYGDDDDGYGDDEDDYDDELEDDDEEDDDDDDSWKVRRGAIRALIAVVNAKQHDPSLLWTKVYPVRKTKKNSATTVANALVTRFKEREENCRVDVVDCFTRLLSVTISAASIGVVSFAQQHQGGNGNDNKGVGGSGNGNGVDDDAMDTAVDGAVVIDLRTKFGPAVVKACVKLLSIKKGGEQSKSSALSLLSTLSLAPGGVGGEAEVMSVFQHVQSFLKHGTDGGIGGAGGGGAAGPGLHRETSNKTLKLDALRLIRVMLSSQKHDPAHIKTGLYQTLLRDLCATLREQWYKVIAEALRVLTEVPRFFVTGYGPTASASARGREMTSVASSMYEAIYPLLAASDVDQEIKECALLASASLLSVLHTHLSRAHVGNVLSLLLEKLRNETTRIAAIKTLSAIAAASSSSSSSGNGGNATTASMDVDGADGGGGGKIDLSPILSDAISAMGSYLRQQNRTLKQSSLEALDVVITHHGASVSHEALFSTVLAELGGLIVDSDLHLCHLSLLVSISMLKVCEACGPAAKEHVLPPALALCTSSLLQDGALDSLLSLLEQLILSHAVDFADLLGMLQFKSTDSLGKVQISHLAKCIASITAVTDPAKREGVVSKLLEVLEKAGVAVSDPDVRNVVLSLLASGDLGRVVDYSSMPGVAEKLKSIYLGAFDSPSEEVKHAAAYALGRAAIGARGILLPAIVEALQSTDDQKKKYLLLSALKELIHCQQKSNPEGVASSVSVILPRLLAHCTDADEGARTIVAECMGALAVVEPTTILPTLQDLLSQHSEIASEAGHVADGDARSKTNALACGTVATSLKHAIAGKTPISVLSPYMPEFLHLLQQEEVSVRNAALLMVYSAVHHMPQLVSPLMRDSIVPSLYVVMELKLTRVVDLGPFKHTVDDALPLRKSAMRIFATCLEKLPASLDVSSFTPVLVKALGDLEDVQLQAHHIVISMCHQHPTHLVSAIETFVPPFEEMFSDKMIKRKTANKTGTELERAKEWIKSGLRALIHMSRLDGAMNSSQKFCVFADRVKANPKFRPMLEALEEER